MGFPKDNPLELVKSVDIVPSAVLIREATLADCQFITTTYNDIALSTSAVEYMEERDLKEKEKWLADLIVEGWVCLIAEMEGIPVGFLSFGELLPPAVANLFECGIRIVCPRRPVLPTCRLYLCIHAAVG